MTDVGSLGGCGFIYRRHKVRYSFNTSNLNILKSTIITKYADFTNTTNNNVHQPTLQAVLERKETTPNDSTEDHQGSSCTALL